MEQEANTLQLEIIKEGVGESPSHLQEVYFFFICRDQDGNFISGSEQTASRCIIGRNWLVNELEQALSKMKQGERRKFKIPKDEVKQHIYFISNKNNFLEYEIETIRFGKIANLPWQLEGDERFERASAEKLSGNDEIKKQNYQSSINHYNAGLKLLNNDYGFRENDLILQLRSNLSLVYLKNKQYDECVKQANLALEGNNQNVKVLHRRAIASIELGDYDKAREDLNQGLEFDPKNVEILKELENLKVREKKQKDKQQNLAKKMLFGE